MNSFHSFFGSLRIIVTTFLLLAAVLSAGAQDADVLERFAAASTVTHQQLAELLEASGIAVEGPFVHSDSTDNDSRFLSPDELAHVIVQLDTGTVNLGYTFIPGPRYAIRQLRSANEYPPAARYAAAGMTLDGTTVLQLIRTALVASTVEHVYLHPRPIAARPSGPYLEWDLEQRVGMAYTEALEQQTNFSAESQLDLQMIFSRAVVVDSSIQITQYSDNATWDWDIVVPHAQLQLFYEAVTDAWQGSLSIGRLPDTSITRDGLAVDISTGAVLAGASAGYTGFVPQQLTSLPTGPNESVRDRPWGESSFAPQRMVVTGNMVLPEIIGRHNPGIEAVSIVDFDGSQSLTQLRASLSGPAGTQTFYNIQGDLQFGPELAWASLFALRWYPQLFDTTQIGLAAAAAGSPTPESASYTPLNAEIPFTAYSGPFSNIATASLSYTSRIAQPLIVSSAATVIARIDSNGPTDPAVTHPDNRPLGLDHLLGIRVQPVEDLFFDINSNIFVPWTDSLGGAYPDSKNSAWNIGLRATIRL